MPKTKSTGWLFNQAVSLTSDNLHSLFANKIPAIIIKGFCNEEECNKLTLRLQETKFGQYENVHPKIERIGITQFEFGKNKDLYFTKVQAANKQRAQLCQNITDPLQKVKENLKNILNKRVEIASEPELGRYYAGLIRKINVAHLHFDYAPYDAKGWTIDKIKEQISWNICLNPGKYGGETIIYDKFWLPEEVDDTYKLETAHGSYGYKREIVQKSNSFVYIPQKGDLYLFNSRNYHEVLQSSEDQDKCERYTMSSFVGKFGDEYVLWS